MNINATLIGQMITFAIFVWFTMKFVWPPVMKALEERQGKIADGLAAAERGRHELELAQKNATDQMREVKAQANEIIDHANKRGNQIIEEAKAQAQTEAAKQVELAQAQIEQEVFKAKKELRGQVADIAVSGAERILGKNLDGAANSGLLDDLIKQI